MAEQIDRDACEFLPDAEAVRREPLPGWARRGVLWMAGFLGLALLWSALGRTDVIVQGHGRLVSDHPAAAVKPLERAVVKEILVRPGDRVEAGQELVLFDPSFSRADVERLSAEIRLHGARLGRLQAEFAGEDFKPAGDSVEEAVQYKVFRERKRFFEDKEEYFRHELDRITKSQSSYASNLAVQRGRLQDMAEIEGIMSRGRGSGAVSRREQLASRLERRQIEADVRDKENALLILESELLAKKAERNVFRRDWFIGIADEMVKEEEALVNARKEFDKADRLASYTSLRAPEAAAVHEVMPVGAGSAIREAETLMTLVPLDGKLEAEADVRAEDIGRIHEGGEARLKISAFPFQKYGTLSGRIRWISKDAFSRGPSGERVEEGGQAVYRVRIELTGPEDEAKGIRKRLIPGMELEAELKTGTRSLLSYFTYPLFKALDEAAREP